MVILEENLPSGPDTDGQNGEIRSHSPSNGLSSEERVDANYLENYYSQEDLVDSREARTTRLKSGKAAKTEIQQFYADQCVFVTGATGFLGKVLLEKLIRSCQDINTIYVLARAKKGKDAKTRLYEQLDDFIFHRAHEENPKGIHKVVPIVGDMELPRLGISDEDWKTLTTRVSVIINAAATVRFDEKLSVSTAINVKGTKEVLKLAKECRNLKAMTHVSTAFSNTHVKHIEEKFYDPPLSVETLEAVSQLDQGIVDTVLPQLLKNHPNTYCFTKAIAEEAVRTWGEGMPICIVRPSIVISTYEEPVRGWTDSLLGPTGLIVGTGTGVFRAMYMQANAVADLVPVDMSVNAILASAWHTAKHFKENQTSNIPIYNYVSGVENPITWGQFIHINEKYSEDKPTTKAVWYYGLTTTKYYNVFLFLNFFLHYLPAHLVDGYCALTGKRRVMIKLYDRVMKMAHVVFYFANHEWTFSNDNVQNMWRSMSEEDQTMFFCSIKSMSWDYMAETFLTGLRVYLVKDDLSTLPEARKKWMKLYIMHVTLKTVFFGLIAYAAFSLLTYLYSAVLG